MTVPGGDVVTSWKAEGEAELPDSASFRLAKMFGMIGKLRAAITPVFSPDGQRLAAVVGDGSVHLWDVRSGRPHLALRGHAGPVTSLAFSPDGARLVSGSTDGTVKVWDAALGQEILTLRGHTAPVRSVAFDGRRIISAGEDQTLRIWDGTP